MLLNTNSFGKGLLKVKVRAMNDISVSDVDVDLENILQACRNYSDRSPDEHGNTVSRRLNYNNNFSNVFRLTLNYKYVQVLACLCCVTVTWFASTDR